MKSAALLLVLVLGSSPAAGQSASQHPAELAALVKEFRQWRSQMNETTDLAARVAAQKKGVLDFRKRLEALPVDSYSPHGKVDFLVLRSEIDGLDFDLRIIREESRNPDFYVSEAAREVTRHIGGRYQTAPGVAVPYDTRRASAIISALRSTPAMVAQAPTLLTEPVGEMADVAIQRLQKRPAERR